MKGGVVRAALAHIAERVLAARGTNASVLPSLTDKKKTALERSAVVLRASVERLGL